MGLWRPHRIQADVSKGRAVPLLRENRDESRCGQTELARHEGSDEDQYLLVLPRNEGRTPESVTLVEDGAKQ